MFIKHYIDYIEKKTFLGGTGGIAPPPPLNWSKYSTCIFSYIEI